MNIIKFFDKVEDRLRSKMSHVPIFYALIGGIGIVMFWRGVWHTADMIEIAGGFWAPFLSGPVSTIISIAVLLVSGLFVSFFIGDRIILSGLTHEKKIEEKTENEVRQEGALLMDVYRKIEKMEKELKEIKDAVANK